MQSFTILKGIAAPLPMVNVDTDMIIPKQFLKTIKRTGLGVHLFDEMRYTPTGKEIPEFILNQQNYRNAKILVTGENFGCGSSREHAPWALLDFGIRCIIAPSFADIFYSNCFKNGILPIQLHQNFVDAAMDQAKSGFELTIDLPAQKIIFEDGTKIDFSIEEFRKHCLINGLDDIGLTLAQAEAIKSFEQAQRATKAWLYDGETT